MKQFLRHIFLLVAMLVATANAWAGKVRLELQSSPSLGGYVYANSKNENNIGNLTDDYAESDYKVGGSVDMYRFANAADGYEFKGWADTDGGIPNSWSSTISLSANIGTKTKTYKYYAIFAPITYTVAFNGNGSTSGTMSNMAMVYNTAKNLTANAFARQYTVTYNADGGTSSVNSASATYSFVGWAKSPTGSVEYSDKQSVSNLTTTANAIVTLYAQWKSTSVTLPNATKAGAVIDGWYAGGVKVGEPGDSYTPIANVTLTAKWIEKYTPEITGNDYALFVGEEQSNAFSLKYTDNPTAHIQVVSISEVNDGTGKVISYDAKNNKIIAHNAGEATIYLSQPETETIQAGTSATYKVVVSKINNTLAIASSSYTKYVDDEITNIISSVNNSDATVTTSSSDATIAYYDVTSNKILIPNSEAKSFSSKTISITIEQAETYKYTAAKKTITLTVNKYTPKFTWNAANATYYYGTSIPNIFATSNPDCQYTIVSDNEHVAKVIDNTLHIYNIEETANITVTQEENYKWYGKTKTYTITPANPNNHVTFTYTQAMFNDGTITTQKEAGESCNWDGNGVKLESGATNWDDKFIVIHFAGIPKDISFKYKASNSNVSNGLNHYRQADWYIAEGSEGPNGEIMWSETHPWKNLGGDKSNSTDWVTVSNQPLQSSTRYLKLCYSGNYAGYYSDITVTERREFTAIPDAVDFGVQGLNHGEQDTLITFNHINAGRITKVELIGADTSYFTVNPTTIPNTGRDQYGTTYLNITFDNKKADRGQSPYNAALRIYDNNGREEIVPLTGKRYGKSYPRFKWNPNGLPYYINSSIVNIATSSNTDYTNCPLTYTTSDPTIAKVENGVLYIYDKEQEVTITVSQNGNNDFYASSSKLTFTPRRRPELVVPFHVTKDIYEKSVNPLYRCSWNESESAIQLGQNSSIFEEPAWDWNAKTALITFDGVPGKLSFKHRAINSSSTDAIWLVEQSADGYEWDEVYRETSSSTSYTNVNDIELDENTRYLRFSFSGNFGGYIKDINVSELVGYKYLRTADGHYLSRGAKWGTQAVVDAFGVVSRISRYTEDNENIYTHFFFVDNEQYMFETETADAQKLHEVFTDHGTADNTNHHWQINNNGGILTIQSANDVGVSHKGNYITAVNGVLAFTTNEAKATKWQMEDYTEHPQYIADMLNRQAAEAALKDFGEDINTLEKVRNRLKEEDFEVHEITIPALRLGEQTGEGRTIEGMPHIYEQTITGLDTGFYRLTVKALYRISNSEIAWKCYQEKGKESVLAYAYANDVQYPIQSVYASYHSSAIENTDEWRDGKYYSTTLSSANVAFNDVNRYLNDVYVYVEADSGKTTGTLRYGIKCPSYVPGAWLAYSTITLTYFGRKEYVFVGNDSEGPTDWQRAGNWKTGTLPGEYHNVRIEADVNIYQPIEVYGISVVEGKKIHITSRGGLTVGKGGIVVGAKDSIIIDNTPEGAGFLRVDPTTDNKPDKVTVKYTTEAYNSGNPRDEVWQYMGAPGSNMQMSDANNTMIYHWNEQQGWLKMSNTNLQPFVGYAFTQNKADSADFTITATPIIPEDIQEINLTVTPSGMGGSNLFVNSFLAPIDLAKFDGTEFEGDVVRTFYLFNSGSWTQWQTQGGKDHMEYGTSPGQYFALTPGSAALVDASLDQTTIPPMQGVYVVAQGTGGKIKLDYMKHVYGGVNNNRPMRAPEMEDENFKRVRLQVNSDNSGADRMYVIQHNECTAGYDNGYDAENIVVDAQVSIFTDERAGQMEISVSDHIDSTYIGFQAGSDSEYQLRITSIIGEELYLKDLENDVIVSLVDDEVYTFSATPNTTNNRRFLLLDRSSDVEEDNGVSTDIDDVKTTNIRITDKTVYVTKAPLNSELMVYNMSGLVVAKYAVGYTPCTVDLSYLSTGVYLLRLDDEAYKMVCK